MRDNQLPIKRKKFVKSDVKILSYRAHTRHTWFQNFGVLGWCTIEQFLASIKNDIDKKYKYFWTDCQT